MVTYYNPSKIRYPEIINYDKKAEIGTNEMIPQFILRFSVAQNL